MTTPPIVPEYRNRQTGLIIFGIFEILLGLLSACLIPLMMFSRAMAIRQGHAAAATPPIAPGIVVYGLASVSLIWLGIGSILARRWARALLLCLSAVALVCGLAGCVVMAFVLPHIGEAMAQAGKSAAPPAAVLVAQIVIVVFILAFFIVIPGVIFLFYRSPHVKRTCEARDPAERWTDRCPLPVLATSLMMAFGGLCLLGMTGSFRAYPVFGFFLPHAASAALMFLMGALLLYLARGIYRLRLSAWWIALCFQGLHFISNAFTFWRGGLETWYAKMGLGQNTTAASAQFLQTPVYKWMMVASIVASFAWFIWIRRYFPKQVAAGAPQVEGSI
jgi:hypothetical protein